MTPGAARLVSRGLVALGLVLMAVAFFVGLTAFPEQRPGRIVVVPEERRPEIERAAASLDPARDCPGDAEADAALGNAPNVLCDLEARRADGTTFVARVWDPFGAGLLLALVWLGTGALIVSRQPRNTAGWIFMTIGLILPLEIFCLTLVVAGTEVFPGSVPLVGLWAVVGEHALLAFGLLPLLFLLFPDGRPPAPRWRWAQRALFLGLGIGAVGSALDPGPLNNLVDSGIVYLNPLGVPALAGIAGGVTAVGALLALGASLSTLLAVRRRFKRSTGEERQQLRWLVFVATIVGLLFLFIFVLGFAAGALGLFDENDRIGNVDVFDVAFGLLFTVIILGIPAAYLIAILKHGLWGLDVVIRKTVQYAVLLAAFALAAVLFVVAIPVLIFGIDVAVLPVVALAAVLALGFTWVRGPARRLADRIVYGKRATPYEVLSAFSERVGETYSMDDVLPRMARLLGEATGSGSATVWLRVGTRFLPEATWPADDEPRRPLTGSSDALPDFGSDDAFEVRHQGELLGALTLRTRADDPMNPSKERLARDLAGQAGLVLRNARLIEELRASRQRLIAAQDEERRKLERDLHDGAQQQLVALAVQVRLAEQVVGTDPERERQLLTGLRSAAEEALEELRDLARGIYPPLLADRGLAAAIEAQARKSTIPVRVEPDGIGRYPREVESAVYFCVLEALNNVAKYAGASSVQVRLAVRDGALAFEVADDGRGFDPDASDLGTGLQGMADRLDAIGGELKVASEPGRGTTVTGTVPVGREAAE